LEEHPIRLTVSDELERTRLTVFFRLLLAIPLLLWMIVWGITVVFAAIANWFATLAQGRSPQSIHEFLAAYVRYVTHIYAYLYLAADRYPRFLGQSDYPVDVQIAAPAAQSRWKVGFRIVLAIPAFIFSSALLGSGVNTLTPGRQGLFGAGGLAGASALLGWFAALFTGRMPHGLRNAGALALRYSAQSAAYLLLLTERYPYVGPTAIAPGQPATLQAGVGLPTPELG
jgi:Domain of unknown function (DUF4389)